MLKKINVMGNNLFNQNLPFFLSYYKKKYFLIELKKKNFKNLEKSKESWMNFFLKSNWMMFVNQNNRSFIDFGVCLLDKKMEIIK